MTNKTSDSRKHFGSAAALSVLAIFGIQVAMGVAVYFALPDWPTRGQFGDVFGAVNALFSGLAFAGLIYAILLQREDLALQRLELQLTRQELQRSAAAQERSQLALRAQADVAWRSSRLTATNFLLDFYRTELKAMDGVAFMANDPRLVRFRELQRRTEVLTGVLESAFYDVTEEGERDEF